MSSPEGPQHQPDHSDAISTNRFPMGPFQKPNRSISSASDPAVVHGLQDYVRLVDGQVEETWLEKADTLWEFAG